MTLTQAKAAFQTADHNLQLAWGNGDPTGIRAAMTARTKAYKVVAKMVKAQMTK
jgi:outer membrane protein TolC